MWILPVTDTPGSFDVGASPERCLCDPVICGWTCLIDILEKRANHEGHSPVGSGLLQEQIAFYRACAPEYGRSGAYQDQLEAVRRVLRSMGPFEQVLELACGTGIWTKELVNIGQEITAIDASPEMLELNRCNVANPKVSYRLADLFEWKPEREYDLVFMAFWLSHVPPDLMDNFLGKVRAAVHAGGKVFIVDQCEDFRDRPLPEREGIRETRKTSDGRIFTIVKVYYHPALLANRLTHFGFDANGERVEDSFFFVLGTRATACLPEKFREAD